MARIQIGGEVEILVRYASQAPKPVIIPCIDLSSNGFLAVLLAIVLSGILSLWVALNKFDHLDTTDDEAYRTALIISNPPPPPPQVKIKLPPPEKKKEPKKVKKIVKLEKKKPQAKKKITVDISVNRDYINPKILEILGMFSIFHITVHRRMYLKFSPSLYLSDIRWICYCYLV